MLTKPKYVKTMLLVFEFSGKIKIIEKKKESLGINFKSAKDFEKTSAKIFPNAFLYWDDDYWLSTYYILDIMPHSRIKYDRVKEIICPQWA